MNKNKLKVIIWVLILTVVLSSPHIWAKEKPKYSTAVLWATGSDEYRFCVYQAYQDASRRLKKLVKGEKPGNWCVVLDMDETIVSNGEFQKRLQEKGIHFNYKDWDEWCKEARAPALPGAREFCTLVQSLGGKVIIVTNRKGHLRKWTLKNLENEGIPFDLLIMREGAYAKDKSKSERRKDIQEGNIKILDDKHKFPPLKIIMLVGDQRGDLYNPKQMTYQEALKHLSKDFVIIPNPMYGSWQRKAVNKLKAKSGTQFTIYLESNPTTGYKWELARPLDKSKIEFVKSSFEPTHKDRVGSGGVEKWVFKGVGEGKTYIYFQYVRPWEKNKKPAKQRVFEILLGKGFPKATSKITTKVGKEFTINLVSNPTTGYEWQIAKPFDKGVLKLIEHTYMAPAKKMVGAGGIDMWKFKAVGCGTTTIHLIYVRPWEKGKKASAEKIIKVTVEK